MQNQELIEYIKGELAKNISEADIRQALVKSGWPAGDIEENFSAVKGNSLAPSGTNHSLVFHASDPNAKPNFFKQRWKLISGIVASVLILGSAGYAAYFYIAPSPASVLQKARQNLNELKSFSYSGSLTADINSDLLIFDNLFEKLPKSDDSRVAGSSTTKFGLDFSGSIDATDARNQKGEVKISLPDTGLGFGDLGFTMRWIDKVVYLKVDKIPAVLGDYSKYQSLWIKADSDELVKEYNTEFSQNESVNELTEEQQNQIQQLFVNANFVQSFTKLADEEIDGVKTYHFALAIDRQGLKKYVEDVTKIYDPSSEFSEIFTMAFDSIEFKDLEVWVGKSDKMLHRISVSLSDKSGMSGGASVNLVLNLKDFNQPISIEVPTSTKNILEVIEDVTNNYEIEVNDSKRLADVRTIMTGLELYYGDFKKYPSKLSDLKNYLPSLPIAPEPDGACTASENTYTYKQLKSGQDYILTFCLGAASGSFVSGVHLGSVTGIQ